MPSSLTKPVTSFCEKQILHLLETFNVITGVLVQLINGTFRPELVSNDFHSLFCMQHQPLLTTCATCPEVVLKSERRGTNLGSLSVKLVLAPLGVTK